MGIFSSCNGRQYFWKGAGVSFSFTIPQRCLRSVLIDSFTHSLHSHCTSHIALDNWRDELGGSCWLQHVVKLLKLRHSKFVLLLYVGIVFIIVAMCQSLPHKFFSILFVLFLCSLYLVLHDYVCFCFSLKLEDVTLATLTMTQCYVHTYIHTYTYVLSMLVSLYELIS